MRRRCAQLCVIFAAMVSVTCGGGTPTTPTTPAGLTAPANFQVTLQDVNLTSNIFHTSWTGTGTSYTFQAGSTSGASDLISTDVTTTSFNWTGPRTGSTFFIRVIAKQGTQTSPASVELPVFGVDLRDVIDALFFRGGPLADVPDTALTNPQAGVWADGTNLSVLVSNESGDTARANAAIFASDYSALSSRGIVAQVSATADDMKAATLTSIAVNTIGLRVLSGFCGTGAIACAFFGPATIGTNRSLVTMNTSAGGVSIAHELGHAYGMGHVHAGAGVRPETNFMMNPALISAQMTTTEKTAISTALAAGVRGGWTRSQALAAGIVRTYPSVSAGVTAYARGGNSTSRCTIIDGHDLPAGFGGIR